MFIKLLGQIGAGDDERGVVPPPGRVASAVLAHLALAQGRLVTAESLATTVWDEPPASSRNAIQVAVTKLRQRYGPSLILSSASGYRLAVATSRIDVVELEEIVSDMRRLTAIGQMGQVLSMAGTASEMVEEEPLAGLSSSASEAARVQLVDLQISAHLLTITALMQLGRLEEATSRAHRAAARHRLNEPLHAALMEALSTGGRPAEALIVYDRLRHRLADDLGVEPSPDVRHLFQALLRNEWSPNVATAPARPARIVDLPPEGQPIQGRDGEIGGICDLITRGRRLITVCGPGGMGKTRLATSAARALAESRGWSVRFIDLSSATESATVSLIVAAGVGEGLEQGAVNLDETTLVVLDNAELHRGAVADVAQHVLRHTNAAVLCTSQTPLRLREEHIIWLDPLPTASSSDAGITLLALRAGYTDEEADASRRELSELARSADGVPLVLELMGSALRWKSPQELLQGINEANLRDEAQDRPARHVTVASALAWGIGQLNTPSRAVLSSLTVFRGSFTVEAAKAVLDQTHDSELGRALTELVDLSLIQRIRRPGVVRLRILEPIRLFAEPDHADRAVDALRQCHADYYRQLLERVDSLSTDGDEAVLGILRDDDENLRESLSWLWHHDAGSAVEELGALTHAWAYAGHSNETILWGKRVMTSEFGTTASRARVAISLLTTLSVGWNDLVVEQAPHLFESIELACDTLDELWYGRWVYARCEYYVAIGDIGSAHQWLNRQPPTLGLRTTLGITAQRVCVLLTAGDFEEALRVCDQFLSDPLSSPFEVLRIRTLGNRVYALICLHKGPQAAQDAEYCVQQNTDSGLMDSAVIMRNNQAWIELQADRPARALNYIEINLRHAEFAANHSIVLEALLITALARLQQHDLFSASLGGCTVETAVAHRSQLLDPFAQEILRRLLAALLDQPARPRSDPLRTLTDLLHKQLHAKPTTEG